MSDDIVDAFAAVAAAFQRCGLKTPSVILLESREEGMRFLSLIRQQANWCAVVGDGSLGKAVEMADGTIWMECKVHDIAVRWPAVKYAKQDGSWCWS